MTKAYIPNVMLEVWREVVGWDQFEVSNRGRLRRKARDVSPFTYKGRRVRHIPARYLNPGKYRGLNIQQDGRKRHCTIAELVLEAFKGPRPPGELARHLDDNFRNNDLGNLAWGTHADNRADASRNGIQSAGSAWAAKVSAKLKGRPRHA